MGIEDQEQRFNREVGKRIRAARLAADLVQEQLARLVGLSRASITNIEAGTQAPPPFRLALIAQALKIETGELLPPVDDGSATQMPQYFADALAAVTMKAQEIAESQHGQS